MFASLRAETERRFDALESFFKAAVALKGAANGQTAKGLAFVQIYAAYENVVFTGMQVVIDMISSHGHKTRELEPVLLAIFLDPQLRALRDCGEDGIWERRIKLFEAASSKSAATVNNQTMPHDGSHYRYSQLRLIFRVLGINRMPVRRLRHRTRVDEVCNNRNAIAHGRETAEAVGSRFSRGDILERIRQMRSVCRLLISVLDQHCNNKSKHCR